MKVRMGLLVAGLISVSLCGCQEEQRYGDNGLTESQINRVLVDSYTDLAIQNAIIAQHTLYPYHFVRNGAELNTLGRRDLDVLLTHLRDRRGRVVISRGDTPDGLYRARVQHVREQVEAAGLARQQVALADGMPGGEGMASEAVIQILDQPRPQRQQYERTQMTNVRIQR